MISSPILPPSAQLTDLQLIPQILAGKTALFEIVIRRYNPYLYKIGRSYGYHHQDTEDLMQETYLNAFQHLAAFESRSSFKTWIIKIMLNQCYHKAQKQSYKKEITTDPFPMKRSNLMFQLHTPGDPSKSIIQKELNHIIEASLEKLPADYRLTFTLRELGGLKVAETAALMNTTETNVKVRLTRAKMMLRKEIEKIYSPEDIYEFNLVYCDKIVAAVMRKIQNRA
jgi:RNA polymerase sigma-70 factor (ECF subfamily)